MAVVVAVTLAAVAIGLTALPAVARSISSIAEPNHGPVQISACRATYDSNQLIVSVDFKNTGDKIATSVAFSFTAEDAFGQSLRYLEGVRAGEVAPGAEIDNWHGASVSLSGPVASDLSDVACSVQTVRFKDGSEWHAGASESVPGYPPTPNPDGTPPRLTKTELASR
ncbi:MAG TPA: hypothetical protein VIW73_09350 [Candidatus Cybelea sp.]